MEVLGLSQNFLKMNSLISTIINFSTPGITIFKPGDASLLYFPNLSIMAELHKTVEKIYNTNLDKLEVFECDDEFSDTQSFCDHYGYKIEDSCNAILIKSKKPEEFYSLFCVLGSSRLDVNHVYRCIWNVCDCR